MMKWLILLGVVVGIADPILLYVLWSKMSGPALVGMLLLYPLFFSRLASVLTSRSSPLLGAIITFAARIVVWYPGPISKVLSLFMVLPPVQRMLQTWALGKFINAMGAGKASFTGNFGGGFPRPQPAEPSFHTPDGLKRTEGRVVDAQTELPFKPDDGPKQSRKN